MDFFPPQDVMNKVIAEFLSCQQPHPELMADVVFRVRTLSDTMIVSLMHFLELCIFHYFILRSLKCCVIMWSVKQLSELHT